MKILIRNEMNKISKRQILFIWIATIIIVAAITGIIILGLGTEGRMSDIVIQNSGYYISSKNRWAGWSIAAAMFAVLFTKASFLLFEAFLISSLIIDEFKKKTINQLFSYPISKMKILWSKIFVVVLFSFIAQYSSHLILQLSIKLLSIMIGDSYHLTFTYLMNLLIVTLGTVLLGLLPFVIGMMRHSIVVTMLSSLVLAAIISNVVPGSIERNIMISISLLLFASIVSVLFVTFCIHNIAKKDIPFY